LPVDLLVQQAGVGEIRLLRPAPSMLAGRPVALVHYLEHIRSRDAEEEPRGFLHGLLG
jgi:hypothetical protein